MEHSLSLLQADIDQLKILAAQPLIQNLHVRGVLKCLSKAEFKVFSQFGDDGVIQYLIHRLRPLPVHSLNLVFKITGNQTPVSCSLTITGAVW